MKKIFMDLEVTIFHDDLQMLIDDRHILLGSSIFDNIGRGNVTVMLLVGLRHPRNVPTKATGLVWRLMKKSSLHTRCQVKVQKLSAMQAWAL